MMTRIEVWNKNASALLVTLPLSNPTQGLVVEDIDGLDPVKATIVGTRVAQTDGQKFTASYREPRSLAATIGLEPIWDSTDYNTVSKLRKLLYGVLMPKTVVTLRFYDPDLPTLQIVGTVEDLTAPKFVRDPTAIVSLLCEDPDFIDPVKKTITGGMNAMGSITPDLWPKIDPADTTNYYAQSTTTKSVVSSGSVTWTVDTNKKYLAGMRVKAYTSGGLSMTGTIVSYNVGTGSLVLDVDAHVGSGSSSAWQFLPEPNQGGVSVVNDGNVESGVIFKATMNRSIDGFQVVIGDTLMQWYGSLVSGDIVEFNSVPGSKGVFLTHSSVKKSALLNVDWTSSTMLKMMPGQNYIKTLPAGSASLVIPYTLEYYQRWGGI